MKNLIIFAITILIFNECFSQSIYDLDEKYGFRETTFEMKLDTKMFTHTEGESQNTYYKIDERLKIGDYDLESVNYIFYKEMLKTVFITVKEKTNCKGVLNHLIKNYGPYTNKYKDGDYTWWGKKVRLSYMEIEIKSILNAYIIISSLKMEKLEKNEDF